MRLMKLRRTYLYFVSAAFILLAGCESDYENRYPFDNAAYIDVAETSSDNNVTFKKAVAPLDRALSAYESIATSLGDAANNGYFQAKIAELKARMAS